MVDAATIAAVSDNDFISAQNILKPLDIFIIAYKGGQFPILLSIIATIHIRPINRVGIFILARANRNRVQVHIFVAATQNHEKH